MHNSCSNVIVYISLYNIEENSHFSMTLTNLTFSKQTCVVEVGQQLFLLHKPLIQPVSQGLCLHRNLFYWVHPEKKRETGRQRVRWNKQKKDHCRTQQKLSAFICCGSCSPDPELSAVVPEQSSLVQTGVYYDSLTVFAVASACFGDSLAGRLIRVSQEVLREAQTGDSQVMKLHKMVIRVWKVKK